jgi:hypothetical protein
MPSDTGGTRAECAAARADVNLDVQQTMQQDLSTIDELQKPFHDNLNIALNEDFDWKRCTTAGSWDDNDFPWRDSGHHECPINGSCDNSVFPTWYKGDGHWNSQDDSYNASAQVTLRLAQQLSIACTGKPSQPRKSKKNGYQVTKDEAPNEWNSKLTTTIMLKNLHNKVTQQELIMDLQCNGFVSTFDFLYLPIDATTNANRGYAFINFLTPELAWQFRTQYEDTQIGNDKKGKSGKFLRVSPATLQGFAANYAHYSSARVQRGPPETRPLFFRQLCAADANPKVVKSKQGRNHSLIDLAAAEHTKDTKKAENNSAVQTRFCHECGGKMSTGFRFCIFCGTEAALNLS